MTSGERRTPLAVWVALLLVALLWLVGFPALDQYNVTWDEALGDLFFGERYLSYFATLDSRYLDFDQNPYGPDHSPDLSGSPFRNRPWEYYPLSNMLEQGRWSVYQTADSNRSMVQSGGRCSCPSANG